MTGYLLAGRDSEIERLRLQSIVWEPAARALLDSVSPFRARRAGALGCGALGWLRVLSDWGYPGNVAVSFDLEALDIRLNGKIRTANGKGVRALLHAAFNVGLLIHCREKGLPHPGFLVLDTPLLTYREPEKNAKFEPIEDEEKALRASGLRHKFFEHLHSLKDVQFLILENVDPPSDVAVSTTFFSGELGNGRFGLFPPVRA